MFIVHVHIRVKPELLTAFEAATLANARESLHEPGVVRFDLLQQAEDPTRFLLVEVYRTPEDATSHKATVHYQAWRDIVAEMMAEPRSSTRYTNIFPHDAQYG